MPDAPDYAELHCHSNFSFLDGASHPEELVVEAARLGLAALAVTDHDGLYGVVRLSEAARQSGVPTVFGVELTLGLTKRQNGAADPEGRHLVVLARGPAGYARLSRTIAEAQLAGGGKGRPSLDLATLAAAHGGHWLVLTACRKGAVPAALTESGPLAARRELDRLVDAFGRENVAVELWRHDDPLDVARNDSLARLAIERDVDLVATSNAHYATPAGHHLASPYQYKPFRRSATSWVEHTDRTFKEPARAPEELPLAVELAPELRLGPAYRVAGQPTAHSGAA